MVQLPTRPWHDLQPTDGQLLLASEERLPRGCWEKSIAAWAFWFIFLILFFSSHGCLLVGLGLFYKDDRPTLDAFQWILLVLCVVFFLYVEGYVGFVKSWSPWVARRCLLIPQALKTWSPGVILTALLAPLCAMGFFFASKRRLIISYSLYTCIVLFIMIVKELESPWHEIIDIGVAAGILTGTFSFLYFYCRAMYWDKALPKDVDAAADAFSTEPTLL